MIKNIHTGMHNGMCWWRTKETIHKIKWYEEKQNTNRKKYFLKNAGFFLDLRKKVLNSIKSSIFPIKNSDKISTPKQTP